MNINDYYYRFKIKIDFNVNGASKCIAMINEYIKQYGWIKLDENGQDTIWGLPKENHKQAIASGLSFKELWKTNQDVITSFIWYEGQSSEEYIDEWRNAYKEIHG